MCHFRLIVELVVAVMGSPLLGAGDADAWSCHAKVTPGFPTRDSISRLK
jgi:hypothetical protein